LAKLCAIADSLKQGDVALKMKESHNLCDCEIRLRQGWNINMR
jgi:hypothetical protein